jgi:methionyl-tRNA synthetase
MNKFYITTPIFYPTGVPHIGTAYNVFLADTFARYHRQKLGDDNVFFLTGTDEHGGNIAKKAAENELSPQEFVDDYARKFQNVWKNLNISNDYFMRTTFPQHEKFAQELIQKSFDNGDIYEGEYQGWYCENCEAYYKEEDLVDGKCPNHPTKTPVFTKEKNYYFKLSKYRDWLLDYLKSNPEFVQPQKWSNYVQTLVEAGLEDIPVTRANVKWGIKVPFDPAQTIYVWYDALPNYLSVLNFEEFKSQNYFQNLWPVAHHLVGKDIIKFHAILWPAMLKSAGYELPKKVLVHGFFTVNGQKIGKSNNNAIDPVELSQKYTTDAVRYALLSEFQVGNDGDFSFERLEAKYNSDLANNWGNLLNRVIHLGNKRTLGILDFTDLDPEFKRKVDDIKVRVDGFMQNFQVFEAIQLIQELCSFGNVYIAEQKPWESRENADQVLKNLGYLLDISVQLFDPIIPDAAAKARNALSKKESIILFPKLENTQSVS